MADVGHGMDETSCLGGLLLSVQSKLTGLDDPKSAQWKHGCAGTLLTPRMALTCASCVVYPDERLGILTVNPEDLRLYGGDENPDDADRDPSGQIIYIKEVNIHPEFISNEFGTTPNEFNFALLLTKKRITVGEAISILPLYSSDVDDVRHVLFGNDTTRCVAMTWNFYEDGIPVKSPKQKEFSVELKPLVACSSVSTFLEGSALKDDLEHLSCAKGLDETPLCRVDTGSPIIYEGKLLAIVINDRLDCGKDELYAVLTGINNALAFLLDPSLYQVIDRNEPIDPPGTTSVERARSSQMNIQRSFVILIGVLVDVFWRNPLNKEHF